MAGMQPVQFQSRDGLTLHGYLTLPKGVNAIFQPLLNWGRTKVERRQLWRELKNETVSQL